MSKVIYPTRPAKCDDCPQRGRAWCLDEDGCPACIREDEDSEEQEDEE